jgi:hypothetical protein
MALIPGGRVESEHGTVEASRSIEVMDGRPPENPAAA